MYITNVTTKPATGNKANIKLFSQYFLDLINVIFINDFYSEKARTVVKNITARDATVDTAPPYGSGGGVVTPSGETSVKLLPVRKLLTGVPRERAWATSISWSN